MNTLAKAEAPKLSNCPPWVTGDANTALRKVLQKSGFYLGKDGESHLGSWVIPVLCQVTPEHTLCPQGQPSAPSATSCHQAPAGLEPQIWIVVLCYHYRSCLTGGQKKLSLKSKQWEALQLGKSSLNTSNHHCTVRRTGVGWRDIPVFSLQCATVPKGAKLFKQLLDQQTGVFFCFVLFFSPQIEAKRQWGLVSQTQPSTFSLWRKSFFLAFPSTGLWRLCSFQPREGGRTLPLLWLQLAAWQCPSLHLGRAGLFLTYHEHSVGGRWSRVEVWGWLWGGRVNNCWHTALFSLSAWVLGLKVLSVWYHLKGECNSFERSQAGSLHKSIRKLNTVKSPCCLPAVPTMRTEIILVNKTFDQQGGEIRSSRFLLSWNHKLGMKRNKILFQKMY